MRPSEKRLALVPRWPEWFAADTCDQLCAAVDEAVTLEDALRGVLHTLCDRMRWNAGRGVHRGVTPVWYVDSFDIIPLVLDAKRLRDGVIPWNEPWSAAPSGDMLRFVFPIDWSTETWLEFYSAELSHPYSTALDDVARALVPAALILARKPSERAQRANGRER